MAGPILRQRGASANEMNTEQSSSSSQVGTETLGSDLSSPRSSSSVDEMYYSPVERNEEFCRGSRVYHAIFGDGMIQKNDGTFLTIRFENSKFGSMKLKGFYALPKMVLIPQE